MRPPPREEGRIIISIAVKTFFRSPGSTGLETNAEILAIRSRDRDRDLDKMNASELESRDHGLEITTLKIILYMSLSCLYHCNIHYKEVVKHSNAGQKFSYVLMALSPSVLIWKFVAGLDLGLEDLASASASAFWPRLTSLNNMYSK